MVPLVPSPIVVAPVTVNAYAPPTLSVGPSPIVKVPVIVLAAPCVQVFVPEPEIPKLPP